MQREGTHLDKQIALEMAKELENERLEAAADLRQANASVIWAVEKIEEAEEESDEEGHAEATAREQQAGLVSPSTPQRQQQQQEEQYQQRQQHPFDTEERPVD